MFVIDTEALVEPITRFGMFPPGSTPRDRTKALIRLIAEDYGLTLEDILGPDRRQRIAHPRQHVMWSLRRMGFSYPHIGQILGRDHSTVVAGVRRHEERMARQRSHD